MNYLEGAISMVVLHKTLALFITVFLPAIYSELRKTHLKKIKEKNNVFFSCRLLSALVYGLFFLLFSCIIFHSIFHTQPKKEVCIFIAIYLTVNGLANTFMECWARSHHFNRTRPGNNYLARHYDKITEDLLKK